MPSATNLVVKNGAATPTDVTFTLLSPAAGDGGVAEWALKQGMSSQEWVRFTQSAHKTPKGRVLKRKLKVPVAYIDASTGLSVVYGYAEVNTTVSLPAFFPESQKAHLVAYDVNLSAHPLMKECEADASNAT